MAVALLLEDLLGRVDEREIPVLVVLLKVVQVGGLQHGSLPQEAAVLVEVEDQGDLLGPEEVLVGEREIPELVALLKVVQVGGQEDRGDLLGQEEVLVGEREIPELVVLLKAEGL